MIAEQKVRELDNSAVELSITITKDALQTEYQKVVSKYLKSVQLPGFRKGKVPRTVLEQKIGDGMRQESIYNMIEESVKEAIEQVETRYKPLPYCTPELLDEESIGDDVASDLTFAVSYDIQPIIELSTYTGHSVEVPTVKITQKTIDEELKRLQEQNAMVVDKEGPIAEGDIVTVDYVELDDEKAPLPDSNREGYVLTVGSHANLYLFDEDLIGMSKGESKEITKSFEEDYEYKALAGRSITLQVDIKEVKRRDVPALDDEFAQDVSEEYKTLKDLQEATKKRLEEHLENHLKEVHLNAILDKIVSETTIAIPASMLEYELDSRWRSFVGQFGLSESDLLKIFSAQGQTKEDFIEPWREDAEKNLRKHLVLEEVKVRENVTVEEAEVEAVAEEQLANITDEQSRAYYKTLFEEDLKTQKAGQFLVDNNSSTAGEELDYETFMESHNH